MSPVLTALLRPAALLGGQPLLLAAPCSLEPLPCRRPAKQDPGRGGDSPGRQTAVLTYPRLPATAQLPQVLGKPLSSSPCPQPPRPETKTDRDECLAPPSSLYTPGLGPPHTMPMSPRLQDTWDPMPHSHQVPTSPAQASPSTLGHSRQTPDFQGDPWPTQASLHPVPIFPWLPPVPHASLVTPRLPRFPSFPRSPPSHPTHHPLPHPALWP